MLSLFTATSVLSLLSAVSAYTTTKSFAAQGVAIKNAASPIGGSGNYMIQNVKTGQVLSFYRTAVTNFGPVDASDAAPVQVQLNTSLGNQLRLSNGVKCASAQWNIWNDGTPSRDWAAVSYACKVGAGPLTGTATLEPTKQWWYAIPADTNIVPVPGNFSGWTKPLPSTTASSTTTTRSLATTQATTTSASSASSSASASPATSTVASTTTTLAVAATSIPTVLAQLPSCKKTSDCSIKLPNNSHQKCFQLQCTFGCNSGYVTNAAGTGCILKGTKETTTKASSSKSTTTSKLTTKASSTTSASSSKATCTQTSDCTGKVSLPDNSHNLCDRVSKTCTFSCNSGHVVNVAGTGCTTAGTTAKSATKMKVIEGSSTNSQGASSSSSTSSAAKASVTARACQKTEDCRGQTLPDNGHNYCDRVTFTCTFGCNKNYVTDLAGTGCTATKTRRNVDFTYGDLVEVDQYARRSVVWDEPTIEKRFDSTQQFYIVAQDHVNNMVAQAITPNTISTWGGYESAALQDWDVTDDSQLWMFIEQ